MGEVQHLPRGTPDPQGSKGSSVSLRSTDAILIAPEAIAYIEEMELQEGAALSKFEVVEFFFEWLKTQPRGYQVGFLREAVSE